MLELDKATRQRYAAELAYTDRLNLRIDHWMTHGYSTTQARARAIGEAKELHEKWLETKAIWHKLENTKKAMQTRLNGLMNLNKSQPTSFHGGSR